MGFIPVGDLGTLYLGAGKSTYKGKCSYKLYFEFFKKFYAQLDIDT
jgi:hypothetical protein